ncbi:hypothetical protein VTJ04DRAFT_7577 [Mycothermus thermophilus]|uniref:uncharacterized protein n=1 Tax=Humicola insolens TaxID=85995 RepID=UPI0037432879
MLFSIRSVASTLLLAGVVSAQTPPGFVPEVTEKLEIIFGDKVVQTAGESLTRAETARLPIIGTKDVPLNGTSYLYVMIDIDVPGNFQNPSSAPRRTNLHALITGFTPSPDATITTEDGSVIYTLVPPAQAGPVPYVGPAPPPENPPHPHQYVSLIYETEPEFAVTRDQVGQTLGFDLLAFVEKVGLVGEPVRAGYFNVTG